jgi:septum formation protein
MNRPDHLENLPRKKLVLASRSPRRQKLLTDSGYAFEIDPSDVDEEDFPPKSLPADVAVMLAQMKAEKVAARHPEDVVLAADTIVAFGDEIIGKPDDVKHAREILRLLSGTTHVAVTGLAVAVAENNYLKTARVLSAVRMRLLTEVEIERYLIAGQWRGKAGGYGLQDPETLIKDVVGSRSNVVGLPMRKVGEMLAAVGIFPAHKVERPKA